MRVTVTPIVIGALGKRTERVRNRRMNRDHPDDSIVEIGLKTVKLRVSKRKDKRAKDDFVSENVEYVDILMMCTGQIQNART